MKDNNICLVPSYLSYVAAFLLCYTSKRNVFKLYSVYINVFAYFFLNVFYNTNNILRVTFYQI